MLECLQTFYWPYLCYEWFNEYAQLIAIDILCTIKTTTLSNVDHIIIFRIDGCKLNHHLLSSDFVVVVVKSRTFENWFLYAL